MFADFGVVTTKELGLVFRDYELPAPRIQVNTLKVEGRDGDIDLSEAIGKLAYQNREVVLYLHDHRDLKTRQRVRRELERHVHGKYRSLYISDAPNHEIKGRWSVNVDETGAVTHYEIVGDCYPFRDLGTFTYRINAAGGVEILLENGDKQVRPILQVENHAYIEHEGKHYELEPGAYYIEDLYFKPGMNLLYIDTRADGGTVTWDDLNAQGITWDQLSEKRIGQWQWGDNPPQIRKTWDELSHLTWDQLAEKSLIEWVHPVTEDNEKYAAYIQFSREVF